MNTIETLNLTNTLLTGPNDTSISLVGLVHVLPPESAGFYDDKANYVRQRLSLPNSVVHYAGYIASSATEIAAALPATRQKHAQLGRLLLAQRGTITELGLIEEHARLVTPNKNAKWHNHDMTTLEIAERLKYSDIVEEAAGWEAELKKVRAMSPTEKQGYIHEVYADIAESLETPHNLRWLFVDEEREERAITASLRALNDGVQHVTMLWGGAHVSSMKQELSFHGFTEPGKP